MTDEEFEKFVYDKIAWEQRFCVYQLTSPEGKVYIGLAEKPVEKRWNGGYGYRMNKALNEDIQKFGWDNFKHEIVYDNLGKEEAEAYESELIRVARRDNKENCYNRKVPKISGDREHFTVYQIIFPDGKMYVGKTGQEFKKRWKNGSNYEWNKELTAAINACGVDNLKIIVCSEGLSFEGASAMEKFLIELNHTNNPEKGYNKSLGGEKEGGWRASDKTRRKMSETRIVRPVHGAMNPRKPVICVETGAEYCSISEASRQTGIIQDSIEKVIKGKMKTAGGYHWKAV